MSSEVDICNLALALLGDSASVASIDPAEPTMQAQNCARFYPIARNALLEFHPWSFATTRAALAALTANWPMWQYCYEAPSDAISLLAILPPDAVDDYSQPIPFPGSRGLFGSVGAEQGDYVPQPFDQETLPNGVQVIYTNQESAVLRYTRLITDTTQFTPLFVDALSWWLASYLAGPILKGDAGRQAAAACRQQAMGMLGRATTSDANQRQVEPKQSVAWMVNR